MNIDDIFNKSFLNDFNEKENRRLQTSKEDRLIINEKMEKLQIIQKFLQKFVDLGVIVNHKDKYTKNATSLHDVVPQKFTFYMEDSSKSFYPGVSIYFDHPATVEISVPFNEETDGVVVIKVASQHDYSYLFDSKFTTYSSACEALGRFIGKCTTSTEKNPHTFQKEIEEKKKLNNHTEILSSKNVNKTPITDKDETSTLKEDNTNGFKKINNLLKLKKNEDNKE